MQKDNNFNDYESVKSFGYLFVSVAISVAASSILSHMVHLKGLPYYYYIIVGTASFGVLFCIYFGSSTKRLKHIRNRMKSSTSWSARVKGVNGLCWAGPFAAIPFLPEYTPYLLLLGIGLGNMSTHMFLKQLNGLQNQEQLTIALCSLGAIPIAAVMDTTLFSFSKDISVMVSRLLISASYAMGGAYALLASPSRS